jgi:Uma2 family endonuclease
LHKITRMSVITSLSQLDLNGKYSYADYLTWKFEEAIELIKGKILPMSAPSRRHQAISRYMNGVFFIFFEAHPCAFYDAPFDVRLLDKNKSMKANKEVFTVVQPDICVICDESKLDDKGCLGAPDLVIEILSPGNSTKEMRLKKELYQENQVREYWILDPEREMSFQFVLTENGVYGPPQLYIQDEMMVSAIFEGLQVNLADVFKQQ